MTKKSSGDRPVTHRDLRELTQSFDQLKSMMAAHRATDAAPRRPRSRQAILQDMIRAIDSGLPKRRKTADDGGDLIATMPVARRPANPLRAADSHRQVAPSGMIPRKSVLLSFDAAVKAAGEKMRAAYRPTSA